ncbi:retrovirus-related pol polyprotein from transposon TNT 1-94 [Tanacetum coccineum]|uniref:Retrovirus-related pol polyprotein from transposon TNT 1-94 n=1 Tax=Tanacetum coccineum TaxID=301880 RepID=A0ABQ5IE29_9ASTR
MMAATKNGSRVEGIRGRQLDYVPATIDVRDEMIVRMQLLINDCVDTNVHLLYRPNCIQDVFQLCAIGRVQIDAQTKVLREVNKEDSATGKKLSEHTDEFNKLDGDLANIDVDIDDEDRALMLLTSLPSSYDNFVETLLYGRESLTLEDVLSSINSRELKKRTDAKDGGDGLYVRGRSDHRGNQGRGSLRSKSKGKETYKLKCYICYSEDHLKKNCPKRNKKKSTGFVKKNVGQGSSMHSEGYDNGDLLMAVSEERFLKWIIDSSGSFHMTPRRDFLFNFKEFNGGTVFLGDNRACAIRRTGKGYTMKLRNGRVKVIKSSLMVLLRNMKGNCVYSLDGWAESGEASVGIQENESLAQVWHKRLGHISEAGLHELERRDVLGNKGLGKLEFCENYVLEKSTRGPSRVESMSGCRYFLSIVDDYSRRVWVHFLRHKNEAFSKFKEWKQLVENQTGEWDSKTFDNSFWAEATVTASYLINRSPSTALEKNTPMDLWLRHPTNYEMLRIFGCVAYSHVNQGKLKPRAIKCIFLGYPDGVKGYILWRLDDVKPKIIISRDVVFNESLMYKDTLKGAGAADSGKEVEFEVELQGSRVEPTVDPHTGENPGNEDEEQDEGPQQQNLDNYVLVRDRAKRTTTIPARYRDEGNVSLSRPSGSKVDDMAAYAFAIAEEEDTHEPITFQEAINSSEKDEWVRAMKEEMSSLKKNHTWELVDQPPGQKLVSCKWLYKIKEGIEGVQKPRAPRNKEGQFRNQDNTRKQGNNEDTSSKAMLAINGVGFDWSDMAEEQVQTNMALMAFLDSECDDLIVMLNQTEFTATTYKRGLATVEEQLITYRKNEVLFSEEVAVLKREVACKDYEINVLKSEFEKVKQEKEGIEFKIEKFDKASKDLDKLLGNLKKLDLSYSGLDEFKKPEFKTYGSKVSEQESNVVCDKKSDDSKENSDDSLIKEQVSKDTSSIVECSLNVDKKTIFPVDKKGMPQQDDTGFVDSGCLRHMTGNIANLSDFKEFDGGYVTFGGGAHGGRISGKGTLKTDSLDFEDLPDENQILLKIPRKDNMYSFDMKNIVPKESLTCLVAKATLDESMLWHRRLGHINFKNINKLVKDNLVRGLPTKHFENDQTCVACLKGKQHRASCKSKVLNPITKPLFMLHMDLFGPTFVSSLMHKKYCLVVTDDYSRFTWVFFLTTKDETSEILKNFIKEIENLVDKKVKIIRSDNETEFKNKVMDDFCREKGIKREYSVARTPQQNGVAERRNRTLIEAARTMLADSKLPTTFWAKAVSTACYVQNRVLVVKPHNKTPYELFRGFKPALSFMKPFGCHVTILNTLDSLGKFDGKSDEGFFVVYSLSSKAFRVYNARTRRVEENLHIGFLENRPMIEGNDRKWLFDIDSLTQSINYVLVAGSTIINESTGTQRELNAASPDVNTGSFKINGVGPSVNTASTYDHDSPKDMFTMGASHTLEATHVEFFSDKDEPEVDLGNITNSYTVPTTLNTSIHKDHPIENVIGDIEPTSIAKAISDSSWVEAMLEELPQFTL